MAFLLYVFHQPTSKWAPVIEMLPTNLEHPLLYTDAEKLELQAESVSATSIPDPENCVYSAG